MKTIDREPDPFIEARLRRDLSALADQLVGHHGLDAIDALDVPDGLDGLDGLDGEPERCVGPARRRSWPFAAAAAAAVTVVVAIGVISPGGGDGPTTEVGGTGDTVAPRAPTDDPDARLAVAIEALRAAWGAEFPPDAVARARAVQDETRAIVEELEARGLFPDPATPPVVDIPWTPDTVCGCAGEGRLAGSKLDVSALTYAEPTDDLSWVEARQAQSSYQRVPLADEDVQVWADTHPVDAETGRWSTWIEVYTTEGILAIGFDHAEPAPSVDPATAADIARTVFDNE